MWRLTVIPAAGAVCAFLAGCATQGPQPTAELARARTLIEEADKSQAQRYAAPDLQRARDELSSAELANNKGEYDAARSYAESAAADADVATARASAGEALRAASEARQGNEALRRESERAVESGAPPPRSDLQSYPAAAPGPAAPPPPEASPPEPQAQPQ
jgi:Domain of unknown function (DUF4398)